MSVEVRMMDGPLAPEGGAWQVAGAGAVVCFDGVVRGREDDRPLAALEYQDYPPMTQRELERLAQQTLEAHGLIAIQVWHSRGRVPAGACSFRLRIAAAHRKPALAAMDEFIDRMKQAVPLWKLPVWESPRLAGDRRSPRQSGRESS